MTSQLNRLVTFSAFMAICFTVSIVNAEPACNPSTNAVTNAVDSQMQVPSEDTTVEEPGNFHVIVPGRVYRGARPTSKAQVEWLHKIGVKTIIDLQGHDPKAFWVSEHGELPFARLREAEWALLNHILWFNEPMDSVAPVLCHEAREIKQILNIIRDPKYQPVYFHCEHGKDRTGLIAALYEVFYERPALSPHAAFQQMLKDGHFDHGPWRNMDRYFRLATTPPMSLDKRDNYMCGSSGDFIPLQLRLTR